MSQMIASAGVWAYVVLFVLAASESSAFLGLAVPGESAVLPAGALASGGELNGCWLVQCWALLGEVDRACRLFETVAARANDLGLFAEEIGPGGEALGNFPQAFSHIGLVNAAWAIHQANERRSARKG